MFGSECSSFKLFFRSDLNDVYTSLYNIMRIIHPPLIYESVVCNIPSQKYLMSFKFQQFYHAIRIMLPRYKNYFIGKARYCSKIEHDKVYNAPFGLELHNLGATCDIWANQIHIYAPNIQSKVSIAPNMVMQKMTSYHYIV